MSLKKHKIRLEWIVSGYMKTTFDKYTPNIIRQYIVLFYDDGIWWEKANLDSGLKILDDDLTLVNVSGEDGVWCCAVSNAIFGYGQQSFEIKILKDPYSSQNVWRILVGVIPSNVTQFDGIGDGRYFCSKRLKGWAYVAGEGLKCYADGFGDSYGETYTKNDIIKCQLNFDDKTIEFYKNNKSQGIAFKNLDKSVRIAVGMCKDGASLKLINNDNKK